MNSDHMMYDMKRFAEQQKLRQRTGDDHDMHQQNFVFQLYLWLINI